MMAFWGMTPHGREVYVPFQVLSHEDERDGMGRAPTGH